MAGLAVVGGLAFGLVSVGGASQTAAPASSTASFIATVRQTGAGTVIEDQTDADLIAMGKGVCADIAAGQTGAAYWQRVTSAYSASSAEGVGVSSYAQWMSIYTEWHQASILTFCPQYL